MLFSGDGNQSKMKEIIDHLCDPNGTFLEPTEKQYLENKVFLLWQAGFEKETI
jgi:hypothetical protein